MTVGALKAKLLPDAIASHRSVRFIASGKILNDAATLEKCAMGREAHIHVSVGTAGATTAGTPPASPPQSPACSPNSSIASVASNTGNPQIPAPTSTEAGHKATSGESGIFLPGGLGAAFAVLALAGAGAMLYEAYRRRRQLSMGTSQAVFMLAAVWVYVLLFHGLPLLAQFTGQALRGLLDTGNAERADSGISLAETRSGGLGVNAATATPADALAGPGIGHVSMAAPAAAAAARTLAGGLHGV